MSNFGLLPKWFSKISPKTRTPVRTIIVFGSIGALMALIGHLDWVADLYNFGALLSYLMVNISLIILRHTDRETYRSWSVPLAFKLSVRGSQYEIPLPSLLGIIACSSIWILVVLFHPMGRLLGFSWMSIGIIIYTLHRRHIGKPLLSRDIGATIKPMTYKMNALVLLRPEEKEEACESISNSLDARFRLTLMSIISTDKWDLSLEKADEYRRLLESDLEKLASSLESSGYETKLSVQLGSLRRIVAEKATSEEYDFIVVLRGKGFKKGKRNGFEDMISFVSAVAPGKLMVVRR